MNKLTILRVSITRLFPVVIFLLMSTSDIFAQEETYTIIRKNTNPLAFDLNHSLSNSQDSLFLENKFLFQKVRFLNKTTEKVFNFTPAVKTAKISLNDLPLGQYTVMFYQVDKVIVFQVDRVLPFDNRFKRDSEVAIPDMENVISNNDLTSAMNTDLDLEDTSSSITSNTNDKDYVAFKENINTTYNITQKDRSKVQTRAQYRSIHLRPNGKPYND